jgi:hypothetical protein
MAKFQKGQSGNPSGKPKGAKNRTTVLFERLVDENAQPLIEKAIELAKAWGRAIARRGWKESRRK